MESTSHFLFSHLTYPFNSSPTTNLGVLSLWWNLGPSFPFKSDNQAVSTAMGAESDGVSISKTWYILF